MQKFYITENIKEDVFNALRDFLEYRKSNKIKERGNRISLHCSSQFKEFENLLLAVCEEIISNEQYYAKVIDCIFTFQKHKFVYGYTYNSLGFIMLHEFSQLEANDNECQKHFFFALQNIVQLQFRYTAEWKKGKPYLINSFNLISMLKKYANGIDELPEIDLKTYLHNALN